MSNLHVSTSDGLVYVAAEDIAGVLYQKVITQKGNTASVNPVSASTSTVQILADNPDRNVFMVFNDSPATMFLKFGTGASTTDFSVPIPSDVLYESPQPIYTGVLTAVWNTPATGVALVTEV